MSNILLNRSDFKENVFKRDDYKCVVCNKNAVDAHHIIDRSLWDDGGYYLDNVVSLCEEHHIDAEKTILETSYLRKLANITNIIYPINLSLNEFVIDYDKWGNPILKNGKRLPGYIFYKENVQKMLKEGNVLDLFEKDYDMIVDKYPRTYHLFFSLGTTSDDRISKNCNQILKNDIVSTEKLDGENTSLSQFGLFARSRIEPTKNPWAQWLKPKWDMIKSDLGSFDLEICGENMYGEHSIIYSGLKEHFYVFGVRNMKHNMWLSWDETKYWAEMFDFKVVPELINESWNIEEKDLEIKINNIMKEFSLLNDSKYWNTEKEGVVIRMKDEFPNSMFYNSVFKYVRYKHVKTDQHWSKNWKRSYLNDELKGLDLKEIYKTQIEKGLITLNN